MSAHVDGLSGSDIARLLHASMAAISAEVDALPDALAAWHPAAGEWCVRECLGHVLEAERRGFAGRIRFLLDSHDDTALTSWDQVEIGGRRNDCAAVTSALLGELRSERAASVELVAALQPDDWARAGEHPQVGHLTIGEILNEWVHHDRNHLKQMLTNVQDYAWQRMGSAQRFSAPH